MTMATILSFHPRPPSTSERPRPARDAEIIMFPGVRYEHRELDNHPTGDQSSKVALET